MKFDGAWREVGAVAEAFHGRTAQEWIAAARQIRASNQSRAAINEDIVLQAFADIDAIANAAMKRADILVDAWSPERLQSLEDRLFIGFQVAATPVVGAPEPTPRTILGTLIPVGGDVEQVSPVEDDTETAASAADAVEDIDDEDDGWGIDR